ncbi:MAG: hypothetical protein AB2L14_04025 [Candidatus Xenobiia bacterium LiM19]
MNLGAYFKKNPFQNLIVATKEAFNFQLRGHEDKFEEHIDRIHKAVLDKEYRPERILHTIVFGEWGHGKTHFLRSMESKINSIGTGIRALFYEPTVVSPDGILSELCSILGKECNTLTELIEYLKKDNSHFFLLIDEVQSLVGEDIDKITISDNFKGYYQFLYDLIQTAEHHYFNLHIFQGFSANSAKAIDEIGKLPFVRKLRENKHIFTLNSLSEINQWLMLCDHINYTLNEHYSNSIDISTLISRDVNMCINKLTGGNPRWVLMLMNEIYNMAYNRPIIDATICFETLNHISRIDDPGQKYFDPFIIKNVIGPLSKGLAHEQAIAALFNTKQALLLGGWGKLLQKDVDDFGLKSSTIKKSCPTLRNISIFRADENGEFFLTQKFLDEIKIYSPRTIFEADEREIQISITFEPEEYLRHFADGMKRILEICHIPVTYRETRVGINKLDMLCVDTIPDSESGYRLRIGILIYKGLKIPYKVFEAAEQQINKGSCEAVLFLEDTELPSSDSTSDFSRFLSEYKGNLSISKRFIFIRGISGEQTGFGEQFFVKLAKPREIMEFQDAQQILDSIQIQKEIKRICDESVFCPDEMVRILIDRIIALRGTYTIAEIKALDNQFHWVCKEKLAPLTIDYLEKTGTKYSAKTVRDIKPFKFILKTIKEQTSPLTYDDLHNKFRLELLLTGNEESKKAAIQWIISILQREGLVELENKHLKFKDIDRDIEKCEREFKEASNSLTARIQQFKDREMNEEHMGMIITRLLELSDDSKNNHHIKNSEKLNYKHKLDSWIQKVVELEQELEKIRESVKKQLESEIIITRKKLDEMSELCEAFEGIELPISKPYKRFKSELNDLEIQMNHDIPREKAIRNRNKELQQNIQAMNQLVMQILNLSEFLENDTKNSIDKGKLLLSYALIKKHSGKASITFRSKVHEYTLSASGGNN